MVASAYSILKHLKPQVQTVPQFSCKAKPVTTLSTAAGPLLGPNVLITFFVAVSKYLTNVT